MFKKFSICMVTAFVLSGCSHKEVAIVVDKPTVPVYVPAEVASPEIILFVTKDNDGNTLYSFDENNFIKLKKFLLDITRNNEFTREVVCYYNKDICELKAIYKKK